MQKITFDPVQFAESLIRNHDVSNLQTLKAALTSTRRDQTAEEIVQIQQDLKERGGSEIGAQLKQRQQQGQLDLTQATELLKDLKQNFDNISKSLEKADTHKKNAALISNLVLELNTLNKGEMGAVLPPEHIIYLRHALQSKQLNQYARVISNQAQQLINQKYESTQKELISNFQSYCWRKEVEPMRKTFKLLQAFEGEKACLQFYVSRVADSLDLQFICSKPKSGLTSVQFLSVLDSACTQLEQMFLREIINNHPRLVFVFGEADTILSLLLCEAFELRLKPFLIKMLDSDTISQQRFLEYLKCANDRVTSLVNNINSQSLQLGKPVDSLMEHLFNKLLGPMISNYFEIEFKFLVDSLDGVAQNILEPLKKKKTAMIDVRNLLGNDQEAKLTAMAESVNRAECSETVSLIHESIKRCLSMSSSNPVVYAGQLITVSLEKLYNEIFLHMANHMSDCLKSDLKLVSKTLETVGDLGRVIKQFDIVFADKIIVSIPSSGKEKYEGHRKRLSINLEQILIKILLELVNQILQKTQKTLTTDQKKNDFSKFERIQDNSAACKKVVQFLQPLIGHIKVYAWPSHLAKILGSLGTGFLSIIVDHFSKFTVSQEKAILLTNDMNKYRFIIAMCDNEQLLLDFEKYRQMMNLFILPPEALPSFIHEEPIASIDSNILATYISHREDFKQAKLARSLPSLFQFC